MKIPSLIACLLLITITPAGAAPVTPGGLSAIARAVGPCGDPCVVSGSNGGRIVDFEDAADAIRTGGRQKLVIDGYCASSCMVLADRARPKACITPRAVFAYHKTNRNRPIPLSSGLRKWIVSNGGFPENTGTPGIMPNHVAQRFWPQCQSV